MDAELRLRHARKFIEVAELVADLGNDAEYTSQSASLAVLAGIAASDAACCKALGYRSRDKDHRGATAPLRNVEPGGSHAAVLLGRLLAIKDQAHYGMYVVSRQSLRAALRQASKLVQFAEATMDT